MASPSVADTNPSAGAGLQFGPSGTRATNLGSDMVPPRGAVFEISEFVKGGQGRSRGLGVGTSVGNGAGLTGGPWVGPGAGTGVVMSVCVCGGGGWVGGRFWSFKVTLI